MAVIDSTSRQTVNDITEDARVLTLTNGDKNKFQEALIKWNFKDPQSLLRFSISLLLEAEDKEIAIKREGLLTKIRPADHAYNENNASKVK